MLGVSAREILLYLSIKYEGEWDLICKAIVERESINDEELKQCLLSFKGRYITICDENYPSKFNKIYKPPFVLYYYGDLSLINKPCLAVVGSRECSDYAKQSTFKIVKELDNKLVIISGLAKGIDASAHQAAIDVNGKTIAILGSGIDYCYPLENKGIYDEIKKNHLLISEYPFNSPPKKHHFPYRNRLIGALGDSLLIVEAKESSSGTYHTLRAALELGKDVYCLPSPFLGNSLTNRLIQEGALLVESGKDILNDMKIS